MIPIFRHARRRRDALQSARLAVLDRGVVWYRAALTAAGVAWLSDLSTPALESLALAAVDPEQGAWQPAAVAQSRA